MQVHDMAQARRCEHKARRTKGASLIVKSANVGAVRVSASGWEGWVLDGLQVSWTPACQASCFLDLKRTILKGLSHHITSHQHLPELCSMNVDEDTSHMCNLQKLWTSQDRVPPTVILIELYPEAMQRHNYPGGASALLRKLHSAGYSHILHSG